MLSMDVGSIYIYVCVCGSAKAVCWKRTSSETEVIVLALSVEVVGNM